MTSKNQQRSSTLSGRAKMKAILSLLIIIFIIRIYYYHITKGRFDAFIYFGAKKNYCGSNQLYSCTMNHFHFRLHIKNFSQNSYFHNFSPFYRSTFNFENRVYKVKMKEERPSRMSSSHSSVL